MPHARHTIGLSTAKAGSAACVPMGTALGTGSSGPALFLWEERWQHIPHLMPLYRLLGLQQNNCTRCSCSVLWGRLWAQKRLPAHGATSVIDKQGQTMPDGSALAACMYCNLPGLMGMGPGMGSSSLPLLPYG